MTTQLIPLPEVERLSASVVRILAGNPGKVGQFHPALFCGSSMLIRLVSLFMEAD